MLIPIPAETEFPVVFVTSKCHIMTIDGIHTGKLTQQLLPTRGLHEVRANILFQTLMGTFRINPCTSGVYLYCFEYRSTVIYRGTWTKWRIKSDSRDESRTLKERTRLADPNRASYEGLSWVCGAKDEWMEKMANIDAKLDANRDKFTGALTKFESMWGDHLGGIGVAKNLAELVSDENKHVHCVLYRAQPK